MQEIPAAWLYASLQCLSLEDLKGHGMIRDPPALGLMGHRALVSPCVKYINCIASDSEKVNSVGKAGRSCF